MLEKNSLIHPNRKRPTRHHGSYGFVDPNAELTTAFINQTDTSMDGLQDRLPMNDAGNVINSKDWIREKYK